MGTRSLEGKKVYLLTVSVEDVWWSVGLEVVAEDGHMTIICCGVVLRLVLVLVLLDVLGWAG